VWVAGLPVPIGELEAGFLMASCGKEVEAGQSLVRSGGSLVLSLGGSVVSGLIVPVTVVISSYGLVLPSDLLR
jgi:hypothetical protein